MLDKETDQLEQPSKYIHFYKDYYITIDSRQYSLFKKTDKVDKEGKPIYYSQDCYTRHLDVIADKVSILEQCDGDFKNIIELIANTQKMILELKKDIKKATEIGVK